MRWDGLIERLVYYKDDNYKDLIECRDFYQRRKDMLKKRIYYLKEMKVLSVGLHLPAIKSLSQITLVSFFKQADTISFLPPVI